MILLVFFAPFFIVIGWLVMVDSSNDEEVRAFFKKAKCQEVFYYRSRYKSICDSKILLINNQFSLDFSSNEKILFSEIEKIQEKNNSIEIQTQNKLFILFFEKNEEIKTFKKSLEDKI